MSSSLTYYNKLPEDFSEIDLQKKYQYLFYPSTGQVQDNLIRFHEICERILDEKISYPCLNEEIVRFMSLLYRDINFTCVQPKNDGLKSTIENIALKNIHRYRKILKAQRKEKNKFDNEIKMISQLINYCCQNLLSKFDYIEYRNSPFVPLATVNVREMEKPWDGLFDHNNGFFWFVDSKPSDNIICCNRNMDVIKCYTADKPTKINLCEQRIIVHSTYSDKVFIYRYLDDSLRCSQSISLVRLCISFNGKDIALLNDYDIFVDGEYAVTLNLLKEQAFFVDSYCVLKNNVLMTSHTDQRVASLDLNNFVCDLHPIRGVHMPNSIELVDDSLIIADKEDGKIKVFDSKSLSLKKSIGYFSKRNFGLADATKIFSCFFNEQRSIGVISWLRGDIIFFRRLGGRPEGNQKEEILD